jgi:hypothetical protein
MLDREHDPYCASFCRHRAPALSSFAMACFLKDVAECDQWGLRLGDQWAMIYATSLDARLLLLRHTID